MRARAVPWSIVGFVLLLFAPRAGGLQEDWLQFRGPGSNGVSGATGIPTTWDADTNLRWQVELPGPGSSSPVVVAGKVYLTWFRVDEVPGAIVKPAGVVGLYLGCFDLETGRPIFRVEVARRPLDEEVRPDDTPGHGRYYHGYATSTPVSDGQHLYVFLGSSGVSCFRLDGPRLWTRRVGNGGHAWGSAASPVLFEDFLFVNASVEDLALIALDKNTGEERWRSEDLLDNWCTPHLVTTSERTELLLSGTHRLRAFDPRTGEELWSCENGVENYECASPVSHGGMVYVAGEGSLAVAAGGQGDVTESRRRWFKGRGGGVPSPVYHEGFLFWVRSGVVHCVEATTGQDRGRRRLDPLCDAVWASPMVVDGKLWIVSRTDGVYVLEADPELALVSSVPPLDESMFHASPVPVGSRLLLRSDEALYCIGADRDPRP